MFFGFICFILMMVLLYVTYKWPLWVQSVIGQSLVDIQTIEQRILHAKPEVPVANVAVAATTPQAASAPIPAPAAPKAEPAPAPKPDPAPAPKPAANT